jgi:hypothetical protein
MLPAAKDQRQNSIMSPHPTLPPGAMLADVVGPGVIQRVLWVAVAGVPTTTVAVETPGVI